MTEDKATARPWKAFPQHVEEGPAVVRAPAGHVVASFASDDDAALTASAVNSHDDLVAALKELIESSDEYDESEVADRRCRFAIESGRAALKKAGAE